MAQPAIRIDNLSKQYQIGAADLKHRDFRDAVKDFLLSPLRQYRKLRGAAAESATVWALKDVCFEVQPGEVVGVIGRNGAGKSTLLKVLSRITEPTAGQVEIFGRVASLLEVGTGFHPDLTGRENIYLNGAILGMHRAEIKRKFDEIVDFSEVGKFIDTPVKRYSSGMYLRLAFAVAAHLEPEVLLVDEVLAVGDAGFQKNVLGKMGDFAHQGRTVIFVSHNMPAVGRLCDRVLLFEAGRLAEDGPSHSVMEKYLASGLAQAGERVWPNPKEAPGNHVARLHAVRALDNEYRVACEFDVRDTFFLEVEFQVLESGHDLTVGIQFYNETGDVLFVTGDFQASEWQGRSRPAGLYRSLCKIPGDLLNECTLTVLTAVTTQPHTLHAIERDAVVLRIVDKMEPGGARGSYTRPWPGGAFRPWLEWSTEYASTEEPGVVQSGQRVSAR